MDKIAGANELNTINPSEVRPPEKPVEAGKGQHTAAVYVDFDNLYYSVLNTYSERLDWEYLVDLCREGGGQVAFIYAFGDWENYGEEMRAALRSGAQPVMAPASRKGKTSTDSYLIVAAMRLLMQNSPVDTMILVSGDRDFIPLVNEFKLAGKRVMVLGVPGTMSGDLQSVADEIIDYQAQTENGRAAAAVEPAEEMGEGFKILADVLSDIEDIYRSEGGTEEESDEDCWVKLQTLNLRLKKLYPDFNPEDYEYDGLWDMVKNHPLIECQDDEYDGADSLIRLIEKRQVEPAHQPSSQHPGSHRKSTHPTSPRQSGHQPTHQSGDDKLAYGTVLSIKEGYGFIEPDEGGENIFFHFSKTKTEFGELEPGDRVSYHLIQTNRGPNAENVEREESSPQNYNDHYSRL